jgi:AraC-like DNA-binding protein
MLKCPDIVSFRDYAEFCEATAEAGSMTYTSDGVVSHRKPPFATICHELYRLFDVIDLNVYKIIPSADIEFRYGLEQDFFEIGYVTEGSFYLQTKGYEDKTICPNHLYISPPMGSRGKITYYKNKPLKTLSFIAYRESGEVINEILGENGGELWAEMIGAGRFSVMGKKPYPMMPILPDVTNSLLSVAECHYPRRIRKMFFENMFRDILLRIIANRLPEDEISKNNIDMFEDERIRSVPGILMERLDLPPSIPELARGLSMSATKLKLGFKKIFGKPIYAYHHDACMERASIMLLDTKKSIFEIAIEAGYSGNGNFCNAFKKRYGVSPIQYRRNGRSALPPQQS